LDSESNATVIDSVINIEAGVWDSSSLIAVNTTFFNISAYHQAGVLSKSSSLNFTDVVANHITFGNPGHESPATMNSSVSMFGSVIVGTVSFMPNTSVTREFSIEVRDGNNQLMDNEPVNITVGGQQVFYDLTDSGYVYVNLTFNETNYTTSFDVGTTGAVITSFNLSADTPILVDASCPMPSSGDWYIYDSEYICQSRAYDMNIYAYNSTLIFENVTYSDTPTIRLSNSSFNASTSSLDGLYAYDISTVVLVNTSCDDFESSQNTSTNWINSSGSNTVGLGPSGNITLTDVGPSSKSFIISPSDSNYVFNLSNTSADGYINIADYAFFDNVTFFYSIAVENNAWFEIRNSQSSGTNLNSIEATIDIVNTSFDTVRFLVNSTAYIENSTFNTIDVSSDDSSSEQTVLEFNQSTVNALEVGNDFSYDSVLITGSVNIGSFSMDDNATITREFSFEVRDANNQLLDNEPINITVGGQQVFYDLTDSGYVYVNLTFNESNYTTLFDVGTTGPVFTSFNISADTPIFVDTSCPIPSTGNWTIINSSYVCEDREFPLLVELYNSSLEIINGSRAGLTLDIMANSSYLNVSDTVSGNFEVFLKNSFNIL